MTTRKGYPTKVAFVDQGHSGNNSSAAEAHGIRLEFVKLPPAKLGIVLLPRRWVVERSSACMARFRRLGRNYKRGQGRS